MKVRGFFLATLLLLVVKPCQAEAPIDSCTLANYCAIVGVPRPSVCDNRYVPNQYVCKDFARDACNEWRQGGTNAWKLVLKRHVPNSEAVMACVARVCGSTDAYLSDPKKCQDKLAPILYGHAVNIVEITDASARRLKQYHFAIVEPQLSNPLSALICVWQQKSPSPVIPPKCKKILDERYFAEKLAACPSMPYDAIPADCNEPTLGDPGYRGSGLLPGVASK